MMRSLRRFAIAGIAGALLVGAGSANAVAAEPFGQHVAMCAHETLGQRDNPPAVTCDGMSFDNFGLMVEHMREMH